MYVMVLSVPVMLMVIGQLCPHRQYVMVFNGFLKLM